MLFKMYESQLKMKKERYCVCALWTLSSSRFQEGKVPLVGTLTINVTFIYYNPHLSKTHI